MDIAKLLVLTNKYGLYEGITKTGALKGDLLNKYRKAKNVVSTVAKEVPPLAKGVGYGLTKVAGTSIKRKAEKMQTNRRLQDKPYSKRASMIHRLGSSLERRGTSGFNRLKSDFEKRKAKEDGFRALSSISKPN